VAGEGAVLLPLTEAEGEQQLGHPRQHGNHDCDLEDRPITEVPLQPSKELFADGSIRGGIGEEGSKLERSLLPLAEGTPLEVVKRRDLLLADTAPPRRGDIAPVSGGAAVELAQTQADQLLHPPGGNALEEQLTVELLIIEAGDVRSVGDHLQKARFIAQGIGGIPQPGERLGKLLP
jgi:hypothetical protein